jgi:glucose 1-dehydrogenase
MGSVSYDFEGETVVVTGGSSGIGRAAALRFGAAGGTVVVADICEAPRDADADVPTHEAIRERGGDAAFVECDVADRANLEALVEAAREFGGVDVMVNNAGAYVEAGALDVTPADLERLWRVNVGGVLFGTQVAATDMLEREDPGVVVNTASISSALAQHDQIAYDATKGAVGMVTRGTALELAEHGIRVNAVAPGQIATAFGPGGAAGAVEAAASDAMLKPIPLGRAGFPGDVAGAYCWLASEDAGYVTGELLYVDGGWQVG